MKIDLENKTIALYKAKLIDEDRFVIGEYFSDSVDNKHYIRYHEIGQGYPHFIESHFIDYEIDITTLKASTGYYIDYDLIFFGDKLSNNYGTDKEVIREVVEHEGCKMMKLIKGKSSMPIYISLHEHHKLNYKIINDLI